MSINTPCAACASRAFAVRVPAAQFGRGGRPSGRGTTAKVLGLSFGHDAAAALVVDGRIVAAAEEERFVGVKHSVGHPLPERATAFCLGAGALTPGDLDAVALFKPARIAWWRQIVRPMAITGLPFLRPRLARSLVEDAIRFLVQGQLRGDPFGATRLGFDASIVRGVSHHVAHAASAYYCSGFDRADVLVADAAGSHEATSLYRADGGDLTLSRQIDWPDSLGYFYSAFTEYLGYETREGEGRIMGLAPYGTPDLRADALAARACRSTESEYRVDPNLVGFAPPYAIANLERELGPRARSVGDLDAPRFRSVAYALQKRLEDVVLHLLDRWGIGDRLCLAGGVALNCKMNGAILDRGRFRGMFVQPAANDPGSALGSALAVAKDLGDSVRREMRDAYLGPAYDDETIAAALDARKIPYEEVADIEDEVADLLACDKIVGWFQGRMEFGPRALGARSILMSPTRAENKDIINAQVKFREAYRPFCPSLLAEAADEYLVDARPSPFMILSFVVRPEKRREIPAVTHVDGTCRPQTVERDVNPRYWKVIRRFESRSSVPVVLNTSLNVRGKPIACSPADALAAYFTGGIDHMAMGNLLLSKTAVTRRSGLRPAADADRLLAAR
ncbi:MAG: carbamoyltransferase family protein [Methanobacteriota archaeon]